MEQTERKNIIITCPISTAVDDNQSFCLLRHRPREVMPLWIVIDEEAASTSMFVDISHLRSLQQLNAEIKTSTALEYLYLIAQAAYTASDYLLNIDLRLLCPELIFWEIKRPDQIRILSLPVYETTSMAVTIEGKEIRISDNNNLICWLGAKSGWTVEMIKELNHLFLNKRWKGLMQYLRELIKQRQNPLVEDDGRENINEDSRHKSSGKNQSQSERISGVSLTSVKNKCRFFGIKSSSEKKVNAFKKVDTVQNFKKENRIYKEKSILARLQSWGEWLGITPMGKRQSELIDLEPTENLPDRMPNYRLAMLSEGLPGTEAEDEGQKAFVLVDEFIVGRDINKVDLYLDSTGVGRRHARIIRRDENFFIEDLGSINNTLLDGKRIDKFRETLLPDRCRLTFADRSFYFSTDSK